MAFIFDGKAFARKIEEELREEVGDLKKKGVTPKLVSIIVGDNPASLLYLDLKKKAGERIEVLVEVVSFPEEARCPELVRFIEALNDDPQVNGVMVQLPLPPTFTKDERIEIINSISDKKDVDGMKDGTFTAPVVMAVEVVVSIAEEYINHNNYPYKVAVVGSSGFVGGKIVKRLSSYNPQIFDIKGVDSDTKNFEDATFGADILISAAGVENLIKAEMVKDGVALIDVGSPKGDIEKKAYNRASFVSPVPGGIGPVTIVYLMRNLILAAG
jgi:methylenetetrahydrofolate dehydrogenase (NADP+)/methenyltetrahydrofolate cyclohydrolase